MTDNGLVTRTFDGLYEPSAVVSLPDGRIMVFEDEGREVITIHRVVEDAKGLFLERVDAYFPPLDVSDIEAAAIGRDDTVIAITSHSRNKKGERKDRREQFLHIRPDEKSAVQFSSGDDLIEGLKLRLSTLDKSLGEPSAEMNIEGLSFSPDGNGLLIGLRAPVYQGKAIIVELMNPNELTSNSFSAKLSSKPILLDLGGAGVRAMSYDNTTGRYLIANEVRTKKGKMRPRLWGWDADGGSPVRVTFKGLKGMKNIEGLTFLQHKKSTLLLLVCDDGKKKKKGASYAIIGVDQIEPHG